MTKLDQSLKMQVFVDVWPSTFDEQPIIVKMDLVPTKVQPIKSNYYLF